MQTYHFWADLFDTYQSLPAFLQTLWVLVPPAFVAVMFRLYLNYRLACKAHPEFQHPFEMEDKDIGRVIAYRPPTEGAPTLLAVMEKPRTPFEETDETVSSRPSHPRHGGTGRLQV